MPSSPPGQRAVKPSPDDYLLFSSVVIVVGGAFLLGLLWFWHHREISAAIGALQHLQMQLIHQVSPAYDDLDARLLVADPASITAAQLLALCRVVGLAFRVPAALLLICLGVVCFFRAAPARYRRNLDLDGLMREQARSSRTLAPFVGRGLRLVPLIPRKVRPADPPLKTSEWVAVHALREGRFDEQAAKLALALQLGPVWRGVPAASPHARALFAVFALHAAHRSEAALRLLGDLAEAVPVDPRDGPAGLEQPLVLDAAVFRVADEILRDPSVVAPAAAVAAQHAFTAPALMSLLTHARRRSGVLQPALFNWLRLVDRSLFFALDALGFPATDPSQDEHPNPCVEAAGARDHWAVECAGGRPVPLAAVERAEAAVLAAWLLATRPPGRLGAAGPSSPSLSGDGRDDL